MKNNQIQKMLNKQVEKEFFSAYLYLAIANYYTQKNLEGFANWFEVQAKEELDHALLFRKYLLNNDLAVCFEQISAPEVMYTKLEEPLVAALAHERMITSSITDIYAAVLECKEYRIIPVLDWFIKEQGEEEKNANDLCKKFELFGSDIKSLYLLNAELMTRTYAPPSLTL